MYQRRNGTRIIMVGIILIVLVVGAFMFMSRSGGSPKAAAIQTAPVVVALQSIPQGTTFQAGEPTSTFFGVKQVPTSIIPFGAYTTTNQIDALLRSSQCQPVTAPGCRGTITTTETIYQNLPVVAGMFSTLGQFRQSAGPAFQIPYGYVAIGVSLTDVNSVVGSISPGDDVDLIASYTGPENGSKAVIPTQTQYVLNDIRVIGVNGPPAPPPAPSSGLKLGAGGSTSSSSTTTSSTSGGSLLLLVRYQQALIIQHLKDFSGTWTTSVVLRSAKETDIPHFRTLPITAHWFFVKQDNHFDMKNPY